MLPLSNSQRKKCDRKHSKYKNILLKETGLKQSDSPEKNLMLCNAGLVSGIGECDVVESFSEYGQIESVTMLFGKSYSFVTFTKVSDAIIAFENINGKQIFQKMNGPLYLLFTNAVPEKKSNSVEVLPEGLHLINDFITKSEEELLLKCIDWSDDSTIVGKTMLKHRRVKHYGYEFNYSNNNVDRHKPMSEKIPEECLSLFDRLRREEDFNCVATWIPDQLTINEYHPGHGIPGHVDTHSAFESPIILLSLGTDIIMDFKHCDGRHVPVLLPQRSLLIMDGESRYDWTHGITPRKVDVVQSPQSGLITQERGIRTSFTFRKIRFDPCSCKYPVHCDSQQTEKVISACDASRLEAEHVHQVYENIASHFSETRHKPWPNVANFVNSLKSGAILVDVGCGNGKYFGFNKHLFEIGCDRSFNLSEECHERGHEVFTCDCLQLPLQSDSVDGVISIAVIHHLSTNERRLSALREMARILCVGGKGLVYVWAKDQKKDKSMSSYLKQDRKNRKNCTKNNERESDSKVETVINSGDESSVGDLANNNFSLPVHKNRTQFEHDDLLVPWKLKTNKEKVFYRYYHVFNEGELENLFLSIGGIEVVESYYDQGNWCVIFEKIK